MSKEIFVKLNAKDLTINNSSFAQKSSSVTRRHILFRCTYILARKALFSVNQFVMYSYLTYIYSYLCSLADITISPHKTKAVARCRKGMDFRKTNVIAVVSVSFLLNNFLQSIHVTHSLFLYPYFHRCRDQYQLANFSSFHNCYVCQNRDVAIMNRNFVSILCW